MAGQDHDDYDDEQLSSATPWYNRTPALVGASVAGLAVIGILIAAVTFVSHHFNEPDQAPLNFVEPSFSATATHSLSTPTTTATITSTSPPVTTDIDAPSSTTSSSPDTSSGTDTSTPTRTASTKPHTSPSGAESPPSTTRRGPRTNVTRTLYPLP
jgi:cytoskeletal protein RodZ